tara:strand:+ start:527 stop:1003 length:477 start_codon:yes stop_codon:yes gene_type:complete
MDFSNLTDGDIENLILMEKHVANPGARWSERKGSRRKNFQLRAGRLTFTLYLRELLLYPDNFSCGLSVTKPDGNQLTLTRYNGCGHPHGEILYECHIHRATSRAMAEGMAPEHYATVATSYTCLNTALMQLCNDANISGVPGVLPVVPDLFDGMQNGD